MPRRVFDRFGAFVRARPFATALVVLLLIVIPGIIRIEGIASDAKDAAASANTAAADAKTAIAAVEAETARSELEACTSRRDTIVIVRQLVDVAYTGNGTSGGPFFTTVPGFKDLSLELRTTLAYLDERLAAGGGGRDLEERKAQALEVLAVPDCSKTP